ncbi:uncharacterized protein PFL1_02804 [Pseudozyma flocculosa PF-1]|uniref:Uncharacterized protein n=2 Tax=Pseudozyma flocculosa TaxID=84751 RepID=A0A5C3F0U3_9BASI|nr:uncharacterized protein PFL1_02804 [Pseudozyma flocculosa PF-1]EPQ29585.1 hypothetical protein PFL1_02804 [Pseudozyma flocculosa PF-1]SPO38134.1 uncharacterized protein PSFLO_03611 [Pseudozyma flocculosa]
MRTFTDSRTGTVAALVALLSSQAQAAPLSARQLDMGLDMGVNLAPSLDKILTLPDLALPTPTLPSLPPLPSLPLDAIPGASDVANLIPNLLPTPTPAPTPVVAATSSDDHQLLDPSDPAASLTSVMQKLMAAALAVLPTNLDFFHNTPLSPAPAPAPAAGAPVVENLTPTPASSSGPPLPVSPPFEAAKVSPADAVPAPPALPGLPTDIPQAMDIVTSIIGGVTSVLTLPSLPLPTPTGLGLHLPQINIPGIMGDQSTGPCVKDDRGNEVGFCTPGQLLPSVKDHEQLGVNV